MIKYFILLCGLAIVCVIGIEPGPSHPPTNGEVWPQPQKENKESTYFSFDPEHFEIIATKENCDILQKAIQRYFNVFQVHKDLVVKYKKYDVDQTEPKVVTTTKAVNTEPGLYQGTMEYLEVELTAPCEEYPYFEMIESYNLTVSSTSTLRSSTIWGILRGLETFVQLIHINSEFTLRINKTEITDYPEYPHRGLLLDTSRHFISTDNIYKMLDAMAINKMNVFHWHIVDDQSFPYQSEMFPDLSKKGAYHPSMVYSKSEVLAIIAYAKDRGIRVVPEFDVPGHTRSWGEAFPVLLTECYRGRTVTSLGPMDPLRNTTYKFLRDLFTEVQDLFPDKFFHVGGDEVDLSCWRSNPAIQSYMRDHNITDVEYFHALFMEKIIPFLENKSTPIVWEEVFFENVPLSKETLVQIWKEGDYLNHMEAVLNAGYKVLFSGAWYLDHLNKEFLDFYSVDPKELITHYTHNRTLAEGIVGGEACMWGEMVDDRNVLSRVWPRASAVAERLWSGVPSANSYLGYSRYWIREAQSVWSRAEEHTCRMIRRGLPAQPATGPGFCLV